MKYRLILATAILFFSVLWTPVLLAQKNMVLELNMASDYVFLGRPTQLNFGKGDFTIEGWFKTESDVNFSILCWSRKKTRIRLKTRR